MASVKPLKVWGKMGPGYGVDEFYQISGSMEVWQEIGGSQQALAAHSARKVVDFLVFTRQPG